MATCPNRDALVAWLSGDEIGPEARAHLAGCGDCQARLARLSGILCLAPLFDERPLTEKSPLLPGTRMQQIYQEASQAWQQHLARTMSVPRRLAAQALTGLAQRI